MEDIFITQLIINKESIETSATGESKETDHVDYLPGFG